jgi:hypothetical protein
MGNKMIKDLIGSNISTLTGGLLIALFAGLSVFPRTVLPVDRLSGIPVLSWVRLILILFLIISLLALYIVVKNRLKLKFGIYWDRGDNPYCPSCKKPLQISSYCSYQCIACNKQIFPCNEYGRSLPVEVVNRFMRGEKVTYKEIEDIHAPHRVELPTCCSTYKTKEPYP